MNDILLSFPKFIIDDKNKIYREIIKRFFDKIIILSINDKLPNNLKKDVNHEIDKIQCLLTNECKKIGFCDRDDILDKVKIIAEKIHPTNKQAIAIIDEIKLINYCAGSII